MERQKSVMPRIAVVDDDQTLLQLLHELFTEKGWELLPHAGGTSVFDLLKREVPDVILLDLWLKPPGSGREVVEQLKMDVVTRDIPVIAWSAAAEQLRDMERWLTEHGISALSKPFEIDELYDTIEAALATKVKDRDEQERNRYPSTFPW